MTEKYPLEEMAKTIRAIQEAAEKLKKLSGGIQAVDRNADRILASSKILEMSVSDVASLISKKK